MKVRYDLSEKIVSFDFSTWLVVAVARGATEIVFANLNHIKTTKWPTEIARRRFESILLPMPALLGIRTSIGDFDGEEMDHPTDPSALVKWVEAGKTFPRFESILPKGRDRVTVTLRRDWRLPQYNSNETAWRAFAEETGARIIEDFDVVAMSLHDRFAIYAGAEMNYGTVTGPMHFVTLSRYPATIFKANVLASAFHRDGISRGSNYPWALPGQRLVWEDDELDVLRRHRCDTSNLTP